MIFAISSLESCKKNSMETTQAIYKPLICFAPMYNAFCCGRQTLTLEKTNKPIQDD